MSNKSNQQLNGTLTTAERFRRLVPYVTYYVVGNNDNSDGQYQYQNPNSNTPRPLANNYYYQTERKPQLKQPVQQYHQNYEISNNHHTQQQQHTTPEYLRFPSSQTFRRPIAISTTGTPYTVKTEKSYDYYYEYSQTSPRPIIQPNPIKYEHGFLPTVPPTRYSPPEQEVFTTKAKKLRRPKPKIPITQITTTTTTDKYGALNELLNGYDLGNRLSNKITPENIGSSIQTLSDVLQILQKEADQQTLPKKPKPEYNHDQIDEYDTGDVGNPGRPDVDYPILSVIPKTSFDCKTQRYKGFFGDPETHCQVLNIILISYNFFFFRYSKWGYHNNMYNI